jgi:tetratricopeptide (TPR) repeat protein
MTDRNMKNPYYSDFYENGLQLSRIGRYEEAIMEFEKTVSLKPDHASAWCRKGESLCKLERYPEAIDCFDKAIVIDVNFMGAWYEKGVAYDKLGQYEKALYSYDKTIWINLNVVKDSYQIVSGTEVFPFEVIKSGGVREIGIQYVFAWINKGIIFGKQGKYQKAIECYDNAIMVRSDYLESVNNESEDSAKQEKNPEGLVHYALSILNEENYLDAWVNKGRILEKLEKIDEAEQCFRKADEIVNENL